MAAAGPPSPTSPGFSSQGLPPAPKKDARRLTPGSQPAAAGAPSLEGRASGQLRFAAETPAQQLAVKLRSEDSSHWKVSNGEFLYYEGKKPFFGRGSPTLTSSVAEVKEALGEELKIAGEAHLPPLVAAVTQFNALSEPQEQIRLLEYVQGGATLQTFCLLFQYDVGLSRWSISAGNIEYRARADDRRAIYSFPIIRVVGEMTEKCQAVIVDANRESLQLLEYARSSRPWDPQWKASMQRCEEQYREVQRYVSRFNQLNEGSPERGSGRLDLPPGAPILANAAAFKVEETRRHRLELSEESLARCFCFSDKEQLMIGVVYGDEEEMPTYSYSVAEVIRDLQEALVRGGGEETLQKAERLLMFLQRQPEGGPLLRGTIDRLMQIILNTRDAKK